MSDRKKVIGALAAVAVLGAALFLLLRGSSSRAPKEPESTRVDGRGAVTARGAGVRSGGRPGEVAADGGDAESGDSMDPSKVAAAAASMSPRERYLADRLEARKMVLAGPRYPESSQPLATKTDLLMPHHVEPTMRGLSGKPDPDGKQRLRITQKQDRIWVTPGQNAIATFEAMNENSPADITISRSDLVREGKANTPGTVVGHVEWKDDGVPPDETANDGTWTGAVTMPTDGIASGMTLFVDLESSGEKGTLAFPFIQTATPPARFTKTARFALEQGSAAFYVGVQIERAGRYEIVGRVYDNNGAAITYCRAMGDLTTDTTEVRFLAFGALLLDEGAVPPLVLRDVEGYRLLADTYPDREMMEEWPGNFKSPAFDVSKLSPDSYVDPTQQHRLDVLDQSTKAGLASFPDPSAKP